MKSLQKNTISKPLMFDSLKDNSIDNIDKSLDKIENGHDCCFDLTIIEDDFKGFDELLTDLTPQEKIRVSKLINEFLEE